MVKNIAGAAISYTATLSGVATGGSYILIATNAVLFVANTLFVLWRR